MSTFHLNLPRHLKAIAEARAAEAGYPTVEQYVEDLLHADAGRDESYDDDLEQLLASRVDGPSVAMDDADFANLRAKLKVHLDSTGR